MKIRKALERPNCHAAFGIESCVKPQHSKAVAAFTLVELVISAALMALILSAAYLCLSSSISSQKLVESRSEVVQNARVALSLMSADLRCACPLSKVAFLGMDRMLGDIEADNLDFATHNYKPRRPNESDFCEVSYFVSPGTRPGWLSLWRRRDPSSPDDNPFAGGSREEILRGIDGLRFEYYDGYEWYDEWGDPDNKGKAENSYKFQPNLYGMPEAVRITLWVTSAAPPKKLDAEAAENPEPPMVFQTVARINLAPISQRSAAGGANPNSKPQQQEEAPQ